MELDGSSLSCEDLVRLGKGGIHIKVFMVKKVNVMLWGQLTCLTYSFTQHAYVARFHLSNKNRTSIAEWLLPCWHSSQNIKGKVLSLPVIEHSLPL